MRPKEETGLHAMILPLSATSLAWPDSGLGTAVESLGETGFGFFNIDLGEKFLMESRRMRSFEHRVAVRDAVNGAVLKQ